jgi:hypothetical protein
MCIGLKQKEHTHVAGMYLINKTSFIGLYITLYLQNKWSVNLEISQPFCAFKIASEIHGLAE